MNYQLFAVRALDATTTKHAGRIDRLINEYTRSVIQNTLVFFDIPGSYDTAFFIANYQKTIEGMDDILENVLARRKTV